MYTADDVLEIMDALPLGERLLVVEATLRKIRVTEVSANDALHSDNNELSADIVTPDKNWVDKIAGKWADLDDAVFREIACANDQIDEDEIEKLSF